MMKKRNIFLALCLSVTTICHAQSEGSGYLQSQDKTIQQYEEILTMLESGHLFTGRVELDDRILHYLNGVYLYCTLKNGACPIVLQSVLEIDVINSQIDKKEGCSNMLRFWKVWLENGLKERVDYSMGTGFITKYFDFKTNTLPSYLRCSGTVKKEIRPDVSLELFIKDRYSKESTRLKEFQTFVGYLNALKDQVPDTYIASGAYRDQKKESK